MRRRMRTHTHAGSKALACMEHGRPRGERWRSVGSPSRDPRGQLSVPGSLPSPCTGNLRKAHPKAWLCRLLAGEAEPRSSNACMQHTCKQEQGTRTGPTSQTEKQAQELDRGCLRERGGCAVFPPGVWR